MSSIKGSKILITGGDSGIGKLMAEKALLKGAACVIIWGTDKDRMNKVAEDLNQKGLKIYSYVADVSDWKMIESAAERTILEVGLPDIIINNAGIVVGKPFAEHSAAEIQSTMAVNGTGPMLVTKAFIKKMLERGSGHFVNIASAASLTPNPKMSVYAASKWAVLGWSESLRLELQELGNFHVTTVTTSYINTGMFSGVKSPRLAPMLDPDEVAEDILKAIEKNRIILRKPFTIHFLPLLRGVLPARMFDFLIGKGLKIYSSMDEFTGRTYHR